MLPEAAPGLSQIAQTESSGNQQENGCRDGPEADSAVPGRRDDLRGNGGTLRGRRAAAPASDCARAAGRASACADRAGAAALLRSQIDFGQGVGKLANGGKPVCRRLLQRPHDGVFDFVRDGAADHLETRHHLHGVASQNRHCVGALEGRLTHQHLVQHAAEAVLVGSAVHPLPAETLLRAHVVRGPDCHAGFGELVASSSRDRPRNAEVGDQRMALLQQDVLGLDVAMDDLLGSERSGALLRSGR